MVPVEVYLVAEKEQTNKATLAKTLKNDSVL